MSSPGFAWLPDWRPFPEKPSSSGRRFQAGRHGLARCFSDGCGPAPAQFFRFPRRLLDDDLIHVCVRH